MAIDTLTHVASRRAMREVAMILSHMERDEADCFLLRLHTEVGNLVKGDTTSAIWSQVIDDIRRKESGPTCYGLQRIGFLKDTDDLGG